MAIDLITNLVVKVAGSEGVDKLAGSVNAAGKAMDGAGKSTDGLAKGLKNVDSAGKDVAKSSWWGDKSVGLGLLTDGFGVLKKSASDAVAPVSSLEKATGTAQKAILGLIGVGSVAVLAGSIKSTIEGAAALDKLSKQTGATVEGLSAIQGVAKLSGTPIETVTGGMNKLTKSLAGQEEGGKGAAAAIRALGLDFNKFEGMSPDQQMLAVANAMHGFEDGASKSALAMALFGKSGAEMLPFLDDLGEKGKLVGKVTTEQAAAAEHYERTIKAITASGKGWEKSLGLGLLPVMDETATALLGVMNGTGGLREQVQQLATDGTLQSWARGGVTVLSYMADVVQYGGKAFIALGDTIGSMAASGMTWLQGLAEAAGKAAKLDFSGAAESYSKTAAAVGEIDAEWKKKTEESFSGKTVGAMMRDRIAALQSGADKVEQAKKKLDFKDVKLAPDKPDKETEYDKLIKSINEKIEVDTRQLTLGRQLTESEKLEAQTSERIASGKMQLTAAEKTNLDARLATMRALEKGVEDDKKRTEESIASAQAWASAWEAANNQITGLQSGNAKARAAMITDPIERAKAEYLIAIGDMQKANEKAQKDLQLRIDLSEDPGQKSELEKQLADLTAAQSEQMVLASEKLSQDVKPGWQKLVEGWRDTQQLMRDATDATMDNLVKSGEQAFIDTVKTGQLNTKKLVDDMVNEFLRLQYKKLLGGMTGEGGAIDTIKGGVSAVMGLGGGKSAAPAGPDAAIAGAAGLPGLPGMGGTGGQGGAGGVADAAAGTADALKALTGTTQEQSTVSSALNAVTQITQSTEEAATATETASTAELTVAAQAAAIALTEAATAAQMNAAAGAGGGGAGGLGQIAGAFMATGAVIPWAKGGALTNKIINQPTMFTAGSAPGMNVLGEAGPEAIVPVDSHGGPGAVDPSGKPLSGVKLGFARGRGGRLSVVVDQHAIGGKFATGGVMGSVRKFAVGAVLGGGSGGGGGMSSTSNSSSVVINQTINIGGEASTNSATMAATLQRLKAETLAEVAEAQKRGNRAFTPA